MTARVMEAARGGDVEAVHAFLDNGGPDSAASLKDEVCTRSPVNMAAHLRVLVLLLHL